MADAARERTTKIGAHRRGAAVVGLFVLFGGFCWIVTVAPAPISLALAIAAAVTWSIWLDRKDHGE